MSKMMSEMYDKVTTQQFASQFNQQLMMSHAMGLQGSHLMLPTSNRAIQQQGFGQIQAPTYPGQQMSMAPTSNFFQGASTMHAPQVQPQQSRVSPTKSSVCTSAQHEARKHQGDVVCGKCQLILQ